ncbi:MAG: ECF transporter S component [Propionibacteriales bacterium]|nr:ECF transporter S component [Propionibacteriales bacterium]HZK36878.1 ECF transporter S component [Aeromicrobium sp.]
MSSAIESKRTGRFAYRTVDLVTIATLGVALGVAFWGWGKLYGAASVLSVFAFPPSAGLFGGGWLIAGVLGGLIIRRPGAALATEMVAAAVSALMPGNEWGMSVLVSGLLQGLGVELVFAAFMYRRFGVVVAALGGILAAAFESVYEWTNYYADWDLPYRLAHFGFFALSGALIAGVGGWALVQALAKTGVLDSFESGREAAEAQES